MMDDMDPAAPSPDELEEHARDVTNFGIDLKGDFPPEDAGLDLPESFATFTVDFAIESALAFLQECETSQPRVTYGLGKKIKPGQVPGRDFTKVDCSGFVREAVRRSTDLGSSFPDGSVVQHDWVQKKGFASDTVASGSQQDGAVRIAFLSPSATSSGIGHVVLLHNGRTLESHGGVGPDSRPWTGTTWQAKTSVFVLMPGA
jgi:cell wall-associated NlpC family hydrolase